MVDAEPLVIPLLPSPGRKPVPALDVHAGCQAAKRVLLLILMEFYAPAMVELWPILESGRKEFSQVYVDAISNGPRTKPQKQELNGRAVTAQSKISNVCRSLSEKAALLANEAVSNEVANKANSLGRIFRSLRSRIIRQ